MKKGILLKLISFAVVTALLCMPVFAKSRIRIDALDMMMEDIITKDNSLVFTGSIEFVLGPHRSGDLDIPDILEKKINKRRLLEIPLSHDGGYSKSNYKLPWNNEIRSAVNKLRSKMTATADYSNYDNDWKGNFHVVFTKDQQEFAKVVTCEITFTY